MGSVYRLTRSWAHQGAIVEADSREDAVRYAEVNRYDRDVVDLGADRATRQAIEAEMSANFVRMGLSEAAARVAARGRGPADPLPIASVRVPPGLGRLSLAEAGDVLRGAKPMPRVAAPPAGSGRAAPLSEHEPSGRARVRAEVDPRRGPPAGGHEVELREVSPRTMPGGGVLYRAPARSSRQGGDDGGLVERFRRLGLSEEAARIAAGDGAGEHREDDEELRR